MLLMNIEKNPVFLRRYIPVKVQYQRNNLLMLIPGKISGILMQSFSLSDEQTFLNKTKKQPGKLV